MKTKQDAIKEHWVAIVGEDNFDKLKLDEHGFSSWRCRRLYPREKDNLIYDTIKRGAKSNSGEDLRYRPKSLDGIETNRYWTKIESEEDLPKESGKYFVYNGEFVSIEDFRRSSPLDIDKTNWLKLFTHYKAILIPTSPLY